MAETKLYKPAAVDIPKAGKNFLLFFKVCTNDKAGAQRLLFSG